MLVIILKRKNGDEMILGLSIGLISLIVFGNIENLILASQGVVKGANPLKLAILSLICVSCWLIIGTVCTQQLEAYGIYIEFIGGLAIFILGIQSMLEAVKGEVKRCLLLMIINLFLDYSFLETLRTWF